MHQRGDEMGCRWRIGLVVGVLLVAGNPSRTEAAEKAVAVTPGVPGILGGAGSMDGACNPTPANGRVRQEGRFGRTSIVPGPWTANDGPCKGRTVTGVSAVYVAAPGTSGRIDRVTVDFNWTVGGEVRQGTITYVVHIR